LNIHPAADIFPRMSGFEMRSLRDDIKQHGLREPLWIYEKQVLDGRHRLEVCEELGIKPTTREYEGKDPIGFVVSLNLKRRHLSDGQRAMVAAKLSNLANGSNQHKENTKQSKTSNIKEGGPIGLPSADACKLLNVSETSVKRAKQVQKNGTHKLVEAVEKGSISVSAAAEVAKLPKDRQQKALKEGKVKIQKPKPIDEWKVKYEKLAADYDDLKENRDELADELKTCEAVRTGTIALEMAQLREHLKICTRRRDELMANAVELRKQCKWWEAQAKKLGYKREAK
jgi:hypothetical protein